MNAQIIKDKLGKPVSVLVDYNDWLEIEKKLNTNETLEEDNPLNWYSITETSKAILNELLAYTAREEIKESLKELPDQKHLKELNELTEEVIKINRDTKNFMSYARMQEIVSKYGPLLREINSAA